jgi:mRNA interferase MazF
VLEPTTDELVRATTAVITGRPAPTTHVPVGRQAGDTRYAESFVDSADVHTMGRRQLRRPDTAPAELHRVEHSLRLSIGCSPDRQQFD